MLLPPIARSLPISEILLASGVARDLRVVMVDTREAFCCGLVVGWGHMFGIFPEDRPLSFMWIIPTSCLMTLAYAALISTIWPSIISRHSKDIAFREY